MFDVWGRTRLATVPPEAAKTVSASSHALSYGIFSMSSMSFAFLVGGKTETTRHTGKRQELEGHSSHSDRKKPPRSYTKLRRFKPKRLKTRAGPAKPPRCDWNPLRSRNKKMFRKRRKQAAVRQEPRDDDDTGSQRCRQIKIPRSDFKVRSNKDSSFPLTS